MTAKIFIILTALAGLLIPWKTNPAFSENHSPFTFVVTADMRNYSGPNYDSSNYFRGVMEAINALGGGAFMLSPGDIDPVADVRWTIEQVMGTDYLWYPITGNHELPAAGSEAYPGENMALLRGYDYDRNGVGVPPDIVNPGPAFCPETTFSFDYENSHFVVLNEYCDETGDSNPGGNVSDHLYDWLVNDLQTTTQRHLFVLGHEPAFPQLDADNGRARHIGDSLDADPANRDRFWSLLRDQEVVAYICGHTHNYSAYFRDGVWQLDAGHARGAGDTASAGTFLMVHVNNETVTFNAYRDTHDGVYDYRDIVHGGTLYDGNTAPPDELHFQDGVSPDPGYTGTLDAVLAEEDPDTNFGSALVGLLDGDDPPGSGSDLSTILSWDIRAIPVGSLVEGAAIALNVFNQSSDIYQIYEMKQNWVESQATWKVYSTSNGWHAPGALGTNDRGSIVLGNFAPSSTGMNNIALNSDGLDLLQSWVDNPANNHGFIIANSSSSDGVDFDSSNVPTPENRPKLTVRYILADSCRRADFENDGDVDGANLAKLAGDLGLLDLSVFAAEFGKTDCNQ